MTVTIRYPNGKKFIPVQQTKLPKKSNPTFSNRGKSLEDELNETNEYYLSRQLAVIHKKPVPIQIVNVKYPARSAAVITEAYFKTPSTTDYNGVYNGIHLDFEAKETKNSTSFPLQNIHEHQMTHMKNVCVHGGLSFFIIKFTILDRYFLISYDSFEKYWVRMIEGGRKSVTIAEFEKDAIELKPGFNPRLDFLPALPKLH